MSNTVKSAKIFVLSSFYEGMPNALLEALVVGVPSISTDCPCGGPRMLIEPYKNGLLVPIKDSEKMLEAMLYMVENPEEANKMAENAVDVRERANVEVIIKQWLEMINLCKEK